MVQLWLHFSHFVLPYRPFRRSIRQLRHIPIEIVTNRTLINPILLSTIVPTQFPCLLPRNIIYLSNIFQLISNFPLINPIKYTSLLNTRWLSISTPHIFIRIVLYKKRNNKINMIPLISLRCIPWTPRHLFIFNYNHYYYHLLISRHIHTCKPNPNI